MKTEQFLGHHGIAANPFGEEDAQTDTVFKTGCMARIHHPSWTKFYGSPTEPSTAVVFGEKGSGKTALRLQAVSELAAHNRAHPESRVFVIQYDDFNPFLDHFAASARASDANEALRQFRLLDHMDAILALGVTRLVDELLATRPDLASLSPDQARDLLLLAALYDQSTGQPLDQRFAALRRMSRFRSWWLRRDLLAGIGGVAAALGLIAAFPWFRRLEVLPWMAAATAAAWMPFALRWGRSQLQARDLDRGLRVLSRDSTALRHALGWFDSAELGGQPLPTATRGGSEERYELLRKLQRVLQGVGYRGIIVLIDRVDEPQLIAGDPRKMRDLVWPLLDHKFLRHPGLGVKLLLPIELAYYLEKEDKDFYDKARPDKLNLIKPLRWTGPSLYDLATDRIRACAPETRPDGPGPRLRNLIDEAISDDHLRDALGYLRTPRQLFKFMHRLLEEHCHRYTADDPRWTIDADTFRMVYAAHVREMEAFDRGYGHG